jgi:hypothetical protein
MKFGIAEMYAKNCEATLTLVPTGPATATFFLGQKEGLRYFAHLPNDLGGIRYRYRHKAIEPL